jgi:hypothetical protein
MGNYLHDETRADKYSNCSKYYINQANKAKKKTAQQLHDELLFRLPLHILVTNNIPKRKHAKIREAPAGAPHQDD